MKRLYSSFFSLSLSLSLIGFACTPSSEAPTHNQTGPTLAEQAEALSRSDSSDTPNILIILSDDLGTDKVGAYNEGDEDTRPSTPHIDALAESGILFKNAYAYPICSPTRASILTGRQAFRTGIGRAVENSTEYTIQDYPTEVPLPKLFSLANSGYTTAHFGKWHLSIVSNDYDNHPTNIGFGSSSGAHENLDDYYSFEKIVNGTTETVSDYASRDTRADVVDFIKNTNGPWLAWVAFHAPHSPFHEPPSRMYTNTITDTNDSTQLYRAAVEAMDTAIGQIVSNLPEDTVVFFLGDNGSPGRVTVEPFDSDKAKSTLYEGGINVPFIVSGSAIDESQQGQTATALVHVMDIYRTAAELAGVDVEANLPENHIVDSVSLRDIFSDAGSSGERQTVASEFFDPNGLSDYTEQTRTIRNARFKLIQDVTNQTTEFYQIENAEDGLDGTDLCPCPDNLNSRQEEVYTRLLEQLEEMKN